MDKQGLQETRYIFPYHHLCGRENGCWNAARALPWAYEYLALIEVVVDEVLRQKPRRVLDFGCGDGRLLVDLAERGVTELAGVDVSDRALSFTRGFLGESPVALYRRLDELSEAKFDVVVAMEVLEHIPDENVPGILAGIHAVLDDYGAFIVSVPTTNTRVISKHYRHYTISRLEEETSALFTTVSTRFVHRVGFLSKLIRRMVVNRFFTAAYPPWLRIATTLYRRFVMSAAAGEGAHLVAILKKKGWK